MPAMEARAGRCLVLDQKAINPRRTLLVPCDMAYILAGFDRSFAGPRLASRALRSGALARRVF